MTDDDEAAAGEPTESSSIHSSQTAEVERKQQEITTTTTTTKTAQPPLLSRSRRRKKVLKNQVNNNNTTTSTATYTDEQHSISTTQTNGGDSSKYISSPQPPSTMNSSGQKDNNILTRRWLQDREKNLSTSEAAQVIVKPKPRASVHQIRVVSNEEKLEKEYQNLIHLLCEDILGESHRSMHHRSTPLPRRSQTSHKRYRSPAPDGNARIPLSGRSSEKRHTMNGGGGGGGGGCYTDDENRSSINRNTQETEIPVIKQSDHQLKNTDNPRILHWLRMKNQNLRLQRKEIRKNQRLERELDEEFEKISLEQSKRAHESFQDWLKEKNHRRRSETISPETKSRSPDKRILKEEVNKADLQAMGTENQMPPTPVKHARVRFDSSCSQNDEKKQLEQSKSKSMKEPSSLRVSYDEWLMKKRLASNKDRYQSSSKMELSVDIDDPQWSNTVAKLAQDRRMQRENNKKSVDSNLSPSKRPISAVVQPQTSDGRPKIHRPLQRPISAKFRLRNANDYQLDKDIDDQ